MHNAYFTICLKSITKYNLFFCLNGMTKPYILITEMTKHTDKRVDSPNYLKPIIFYESWHECVQLLSWKTLRQKDVSPKYHASTFSKVDTDYWMRRCSVLSPFFSPHQIVPKAVGSLRDVWEIRLHHRFCSQYLEK